MCFDKIKLFAFDLDGTLYKGENLLTGAKELITFLRQEKYHVVFHTNASMKNPKQIAEKINLLGINCDEIDVFNPTRLAPDFLKKYEINNVYVIGSDSFKDELVKNEINVIDSILADHVVVALDPYFNYNKLSNALSIILKEGKLIIANRDNKYPVGNNWYLPGCGAIVSAIETAAGCNICFEIGKPNIYMMEKISEQYNVNNDEIVVIGDSYDSDIQMAFNYKCKSILIEEEPSHNTNTKKVKNLQQLLMIIKNS